jgi:hypothetical protein
MRTRGFLAMAAGLALAATMMCGCAGQQRLAATSDQTVLEQCNKPPTGSRIVAPDRNCAPVGYPGKSFTAEDLEASMEASGTLDLADALRQLDPGFQ